MKDTRSRKIAAAAAAGHHHVGIIVALFHLELRFLPDDGR
jgi:hypothetical protein